MCWGVGRQSRVILKKDILLKGSVKKPEKDLHKNMRGFPHGRTLPRVGGFSCNGCISVAAVLLLQDKYAHTERVI